MDINREDDMDQDIEKHLGVQQFMREEEKELIKKVTPNYDDFNLETSWSMRTKFVFAKPGKKRFVSQCVSNKTSSAGDLGFGLKFGKKPAE